MAVLAAGTWWLVRNAPTFEPPRAAAPPRHEPDYVMTGFVVQRFAADGTLRTQIEGDAPAPLSRRRHARDRRGADPRDRRGRQRHARPPPGGRSPTATAARCSCSATPGSTGRRNGKEEAVEFRGEFLHAFRNVEQVRSHLPVVDDAGHERRSRRRHGATTTCRAWSSSRARASATLRAREKRGAMNGGPLVFITGASSGIGQALALRFHARRLPAGAGRAARRRGRALGRRRRHRRRRASPSTAPTCATSPRSSPPAGLHRRPGRAGRGHRQRRHQRRHRHRRSAPTSR